MNANPLQPPPTAAMPTKRKLPRLCLRCIHWIICLAAISLAAIIFTPAGDRLGDALKSIDAPAKADFIVVLGGDHERAVEAARLYREGCAPRVIVSCDGPGADDLAEAAVAYGVPQSAIMVDRQASIRTTPAF